MNRVSWRSPRGDWVLELVGRDGPMIRAVPKFDDATADRFGALWLPAPRRVAEHHVAGDAPARVFWWPKREDPRPDWPEAELETGVALDGWIKVGRYRLMKGRIAVAATSAGGNAAYERLDGRVLVELYGWLAAVVDRCDRCRRSGAPLVWERIVEA